MNKIPYAVVLHITEKNCTVEELNKLISILQTEYDFKSLGSSFTSDRVHLGTTLVKPSKGNHANKVLEAVKKKLNTIDTGTMVKFNCQLTTAATNVATDILFIQ